MNLLTIYLMAPSQGSTGSPWASFLPIILIIIVFYFFMIRPQVRKAKLERKFKEEIKKGDKVVTIGGVHGKIIEIQERTFILEVEGGTRLKIEKTAVSMEASKTLENK